MRLERAFPGGRGRECLFVGWPPVRASSLVKCPFMPLARFLRDSRALLLPSSENVHGPLPARRQVRGETPPLPAPPAASCAAEASRFRGVSSASVSVNGLCFPCPF